MQTIFFSVIIIIAGSGLSDQFETESGLYRLSHDQNYQTVRIGDQVWMAENLNAHYFNNGDSIPEAKSAQEWEAAWEAGQPAWTYYEEKPAYGNNYGKLYNRAAIHDARGLCPKGSHVPTDQDWRQLEIYIGLLSDEADSYGWRGTIAGKLKSTRVAPGPHPRWDLPNAGATNTTGFSALPGGYRTGRPNYAEQQQSSFRKLGNEASFWSAEGGGRALAAERTEIFRGSSKISDGFGLAVRCVSDNDF